MTGASNRLLQGPRVCVVGAGVIGSLYAAHLARVADVSALTRREDHAAALRERGLRITGRAEFTSRVAASTKAWRCPGGCSSASARRAFRNCHRIASPVLFMRSSLVGAMHVRL